MSNTLNTSTKGRRYAGFPAAVTMAGAIRRYWRAFKVRRAHNHAVARLRSWSDIQLKDIGISRGQIEFAVRGMDGRRNLNSRMG
jgi:uncharacterized protein YjiS (DUF1127 family)